MGNRYRDGKWLNSNPKTYSVLQNIAGTRKSFWFLKPLYVTSLLYLHIFLQILWQKKILYLMGIHLQPIRTNVDDVYLYILSMILIPLFWSFLSLAIIHLCEREREGSNNTLRGSAIYSYPGCNAYFLLYYIKYISNATRNLCSLPSFNVFMI